MRLISIKTLKKGMVIGRTIWNEAGHPLLQENVKVTDRIIERLIALNVQYVYIQDALSKDIESLDTIPLEVRKRAVTEITQTFKAIQIAKNGEASFFVDQQSKVLYSIIDDLLNHILSNKDVLTILGDVYLYDNYIYQHSFQVTTYAIAIAKEMRYTVDEIRQIALGALLHDVGKMLVPQEILLKPESLTEEEFSEIRKHTTFGFDVLRNVHSISLLIAHCAFQHHERLDGSGYPRGLIDFEIHPFAKIIAVADVFDAVTTNRVYKMKMSPSQAIAILEAGKGTLYDSKVVQAFSRIVAHYPNGTTVILSDGSRGIVSKQNKHMLTRPWVRIFEVNGELLNATYEVDLLTNNQLDIDKVELDNT
ncbi:MAG: HD domain-containing phosphohydrolase [Paenisporosarcina sp.]